MLAVHQMITAAIIERQKLTVHMIHESSSFQPAWKWSS